MSERPSFSQFLIGAAALERPTFLYAYAGMWLHLLVGVPVLVLRVEVPLLQALPLMFISSMSLGILVYGLVLRKYGLLVNLLPYAAGLRRALDPSALDWIFLVAAVIICLASAHVLLSWEYRCYTREHGGGERGLPLGVTLASAAAILALLICGLQLP